MTTPAARPVTVVSDELIVVDEGDLVHITSDSGVAKLKEWQRLLKEARLRDRIQRDVVTPTECVLDVSIKDLISFDGLQSRLTDNPCVAAISIPSTKGTDVIITGAVVKIKSMSWDIGSKFKEPIKVGSSLRTVWLDFHAKSSQKKSSSTLEYVSLRKTEPDRIMGLSGTLEVGKVFQVVPPPIPELLVMYDRVGLATLDDLNKYTATIPMKGGDRVIIPESHYLAQYIKQSTMTYFNRICLFSCANPIKGECSFFVFKKKIFEQIKKDFMTKHGGNTLVPRTNIGSNFVYLQYKEKDEAYADSSELEALKNLPQEELEKKCTVVLEVALEYYERSPSGLLRSHKDVDGIFAAGTELVDMIKLDIRHEKSSQEVVNSLVFSSISHLHLRDFYKDCTDERIKRKDTLKDLCLAILKSKVNE